MNLSKVRHRPNAPLPWLSPPTQTQTQTRIQSQTRNPITPSHSAILRTIKDPTSTLKQILTAFSSAARCPGFRHNYDTYQTLISLLSRRRQFRLADVILSLMLRRDGLVPGPAVLLPLLEAYSAAGRYADAAGVFLRFSNSSKVFFVLFKTLVIDGQLDVADSLFANAADLGFKIQIRYYNELIKGFCDNLRIDDGIRVFIGMLNSGVSPDVITFTTLMNSLGQEGRVLGSNMLLGKMLVMGVLPDETCFKILFRVYWRNEMVGDAVRVLRAMALNGLLVLGKRVVSGLDGEDGGRILGAVLKSGYMGFFVWCVAVGSNSLKNENSENGASQSTKDLTGLGVRFTWKESRGTSDTRNMDR